MNCISLCPKTLMGYTPIANRIATLARVIICLLTLMRRGQTVARTDQMATAVEEEGILETTTGPARPGEGSSIRRATAIAIMRFRSTDASMSRIRFTNSYRKGDCR
jgi:hypothetical protein